MNITHTSWLLIPLAILIGAVLPIQGALLSKLGPLLNHPIQATLVSYIGGVFACVLVLVRRGFLVWFYFLLGCILFSGKRCECNV